jgi:hypothetical protein
MSQEQLAAAIPFQSKIGQNLAAVLTILYTLLVVFPEMADHLSASEAPNRNNHLTDTTAENLLVANPYKSLAFTQFS